MTNHLSRHLQSTAIYGAAGSAIQHRYPPITLGCLDTFLQHRGWLYLICWLAILYVHCPPYPPPPPPSGPHAPDHFLLPLDHAQAIFLTRGHPGVSMWSKTQDGHWEMSVTTIQTTILHDIEMCLVPLKWDYSGNHHTCSYNFFVLLYCSLEYISITMRSNGNLTTQV